jgi:hypothetical protein
MGGSVVRGQMLSGSNKYDRGTVADRSSTQSSACSLSSVSTKKGEKTLKNVVAHILPVAEWIGAQLYAVVKWAFTGGFPRLLSYLLGSIITRLTALVHNTHLIVRHLEEVNRRPSGL